MWGWECEDSSMGWEQCEWGGSVRIAIWGWEYEDSSVGVGV